MTNKTSLLVADNPQDERCPLRTAHEHLSRA